MGNQEPKNKPDPHLNKTLALEDRRRYLLTDLKQKSFTDYYEGTLPRTLRSLMSAEQAINIIGRAVTKTPGLLDCTKSSIMQCLVDSAALGLELSGPMNHAHMVPFWNGRKGFSEVVLMIGFGGHLELMYRSEFYKAIRVNWVHENDEFTYNMAGDEPPTHTIPWGKDRGLPKLVYLVAFFKDGGHYFEAMTFDEVLEHRELYAKKDKQGNFSDAWADDKDGGITPQFLEMGKKTIILRSSKRLKKSTEMSLAVGLDNAATMGERATIKDLSSILPDIEPQDERPGAAAAVGTGDKVKYALKAMTGAKEQPAPEADPPPPPVEGDVIEGQFTEEEQSENPAPPQKAGQAPRAAPKQASLPAKPKSLPKSVEAYLEMRTRFEAAGLAGVEFDAMAKDLGLDSEDARTLNSPGKFKILGERVEMALKAINAAQDKPEAAAAPEKKVLVEDRTKPCSEEEFDAAVAMAKEANLAQDASQFLSMSRFILRKKIMDRKDLTVQDLNQLMEYVEERSLEDAQDGQQE
uniref:Putative DNA recombination protein n=1 Tax=viral metagenome TaxID=1070528 RepID=A0A6M3XRA9_9ZZZZ